MSLTPAKIASLKSACIAALSSALADKVGDDVGTLHVTAVQAAEDVRGPNELAYVNVSIENEDDSAFTVIVDLTSGSGDAFHVDYNVVPFKDGFKAEFVKAGSVDDTPAVA